MKNAIRLAFLAFSVALFSEKSSAQCTLDVNAGPDIHVCQNGPAGQLNGSINGPFETFVWAPAAGLSSTTVLDPLVTTTANRKYWLKASGWSDQNLISNGTFDGGIGSFSSSYNYDPTSLWLEGTYTVTDNPQTVHPNFQPCPDHTGGGPMMVVNGSGLANAIVWSQTVAVQPNMMYRFSYWGQTVVPSSPALQQLQINSAPVGPPLAFPSATCSWTQFNVMWNSGGATSATLTLTNLNTQLSGNDFAIDDIEFFKKCEDVDTVEVFFHPTVTKNVNATICAGQTYSVGGQDFADPGQHVVTLQTVWGCDSIILLNLNVINLEAQIQPADPTIGCSNPTVLLTSSGSQFPTGTTFLWSTAGGAIATPPTLSQITAAAPGSYLLLLKWQNPLLTCIDTASVVVVSNAQPPTASAGPDQVIGCTTTSATLVGAGSAPSGAVSFAWTTVGGAFSGPQNQATATATGAGFYILEVTSAATGCKSRDTTQVVADIAVPQANAGPPDTIRCSKKVLSLAATASSGPNFSIAWTTSNGHFVSPPSNSLTPQVDAAGTYFLTVSNAANGCTALSSVTIAVDTTAPTVALSPPFSLTCVVPSDTIFGSGNPLFQWTWTTTGGHFLSDQNSFSPVVDQPGRYFLTIKNSINGCESTRYVDIQKDMALPTVAAGPDVSLTCSQPTATLAATFSGAGSSPQIGWSVVGTGAISSGQNAATMTTATPGIYLFTVTNPANGCSATDAAQVLANPSIPVLAIQTPAILSCLLEQQTLVGSAQLPGGSTSGISVAWTTATGQIVGPFQQNSVTIAAPGQYILTATNAANGCTSALAVEVLENIQPPVAAAVVPHGLNCLEPIVPLDGSGSSQGNSIKFEWTTSDGQIFFGADAVSAVVGKGGTYLLTVTDLANGCSATATALVLEDFEKPKAEAGPPDTLTCVKNQVLINGIGSSVGPDFFYQWKSPDGQIAGPDTTIGIVAEKAGTYLLTVTDWQNGCKSVDSVRVFENKTLPVAMASASNSLDCRTLEAELLSAGSSAGADFQTVWLTVGGAFVAFSPSITVATAGQWWLVVTDRRNGCTATAGAAVLENRTPPFVDAGAVETLDCSENWQVLQGAANAQGFAMGLKWTTPNGQILSGGATLAPIVGAAGTYFLTVENLANGCTATDSTAVLPDAAAPVAAISMPEILTCKKGQTTLAASVAGGSAGLLIGWAGPSPTAILQNPGSLAPTVGEPGQYFLTVENPQNGCKTTVSALVLGDFEVPTIAFGPPPILTCAQPTGQLSASVDAGGATFSAAWTTEKGQITGGGSSLLPTISGPAFYVLTVENLTNGCSATDSLEVFQNVAPPIAAILPPDSLTCSKLTVKLSAIGSSGGPNFQIAWTAGPGGQITAGAATLEPTVAKSAFYFLKITDAATGCKSFDTVFVKENKVAPTVSIAPTDTLDCVQKTVELVGQTAGQAAFLNQKWTTTGGQIAGSTTSATATATAAGVYFLTATDPANGCSATASIAVKMDTTYPKIMIIPPSVLTCRDTVSLLGAAFSSSGPNYFFEWKTTDGNFVSGQSTLSPTVDKKGAYSLIISDLRNGCSVQASVSVGENREAPKAAAKADAVIDCATTSAEIWSSPISPTYQFFWTTLNGKMNGSPTLEVQEALAAGTYFLTVTDAANGCTATSSVEVLEEKLASANVVSENAACGGKLGRIEIQNATGGKLPHRFSIDSGANWQSSPVFAGLAAGDFEVIVADAGGCELFFDAEILPAEQLEIEIESEATITLGHEFQLLATLREPHAPIEKITWSPAATLSCDDCLDPLAGPLETTRYRLEVEDVNGCADEAFFLLHVHQPPVFAPNSISSTAQNTDNQWFTLFADEKAVIEIRSLKIFDRWGNQVFQNQNFRPNQPELGWPGLFRGEKMQPEVFVWWAEVLYLNGKVKLLKGDLTVTD